MKEKDYSKQGILNDIYKEYIDDLTEKDVEDLNNKIELYIKQNQRYSKEDNILEPTLVVMLIMLIITLLTGRYILSGVIFVLGVLGIFRLKHIEDSIWVNNEAIKGIKYDLDSYRKRKFDNNYDIEMK